MMGQLHGSCVGLHGLAPPVFQCSSVQEIGDGYIDSGGDGDVDGGDDGKDGVSDGDDDDRDDVHGVDSEDGHTWPFPVII